MSENRISEIRVSTIIPVYNGAATIARAIDSALAQDFDGQEIIVVNDGSTDDTAGELARYGDRIRVINKPNGGAASARNAGVSVASADYIAFLDADDTWLPEKLSKVVPALERSQQAVLVFSDYLTTESGGLVRTAASPAGRGPEFEELFDPGWKIVPTMVVMRKSVFDSCGGFCEEFIRCGGEDPYLWLLARERGPFEYVAEALVTYHDPDIADFADKYGPNAAIFERLVRKRYGRRAKRMIRSTRTYIAHGLLAKALREIDRGEYGNSFHTFGRLIAYRPQFLLRPYFFSRIFSAHSLKRLSAILKSKT
ncbi:glycosyltransferase family 2 protein [bacterium]|nr:glycosyltransferase family 2 protein [bacterium]